MNGAARPLLPPSNRGGKRGIVLKTFNPRQTYTWSPEHSPDTVFEYRAYAGPLIPTSSDSDATMRYVVKQYLSYGIVSVTNIELPITDKDGNTTMIEYAKWDGKPVVDWTSILPSDIQNHLWVLISQASTLSKSEERDLN